MITVFTKTVKLVPMLRMNPEKQLHQITNVGFVNRIMNQRQFCLSFCKASSNLQPKENAEKATLQTSFAQTAKENVKTASYSVVIIVGLGVTGLIFYTVYKEIFSMDSPTRLFDLASEKCIQHAKVQDLLGEPIKAFGEESRRRRRQRVSHMDYVDDNGKKGIRILFYLQGLRKRARAEIDAREDDSGSMKIRYIVVVAEDMLRTSVVVEDNR